MGLNERYLLNLYIVLCGLIVVLFLINGLLLLIHALRNLPKLHVVVILLVEKLPCFGFRRNLLVCVPIHPISNELGHALLLVLLALDRVRTRPH